ncbi:hypothetical protein Moror_8430 [Moniliophthora roreri MCA 2997]|uniref:Uncharacterized protein n=1 Tax=Moniliophthora roreri (strain MCA 2997) TaxID=1381753 RepID=V2WN69_MONRO|nr:hypothetical protein Moror_8430 [Moniliophthora roreri MCA 2997]
MISSRRPQRQPSASLSRNTLDGSPTLYSTPNLGDSEPDTDQIPPSSPEPAPSTSTERTSRHNFASHKRKRGKGGSQSMSSLTLDFPAQKRVRMPDTNGSKVAASRSASKGKQRSSSTGSRLMSSRASSSNNNMNRREEDATARRRDGHEKRRRRKTLPELRNISRSPSLPAPEHILETCSHHRTLLTQKPLRGTKKKTPLKCTVSLGSIEISSSTDDENKTTAWKRSHTLTKKPRSQTDVSVASSSHAPRAPTVFLGTLEITSSDEEACPKRKKIVEYIDLITDSESEHEIETGRATSAPTEAMPLFLPGLEDAEEAQSFLGTSHILGEQLEDYETDVEEVQLATITPREMLASSPRASSSDSTRLQNIRSPTLVHEPTFHTSISASLSIYKRSCALFGHRFSPSPPLGPLKKAVAESLNEEVEAFLESCMVGLNKF